MVGELLKQWRSRRGLTQFEVAARAAVSARHLSFVETGRARASAGLINRLGEALGLEREAVDELRLAGGFAPAQVPAATDSRAADDDATLFGAAADLESAANPATLIERSRPLLQRLGVCQFFFGRLTKAGNDGRTMTWDNPGSFPDGWLQRYDEQGYDRVDPLLTSAQQRHRGFFWGEAFQRPRLSGRARRMFDEAASAGIRSGFMVPLHRADGCVDFVSMMSMEPERHHPRLRLGLQTVGLQMLFGLLPHDGDRRGVTLPGR